MHLKAQAIHGTLDTKTYSEVALCLWGRCPIHRLDKRKAVNEGSSVTADRLQQLSFELKGIGIGKSWHNYHRGPRTDETKRSAQSVLD